MRMTRFAIPVCAVLLCTGATSPIGTGSQSPNDSKVTPLILEKNEGERRVWRPLAGLTGQPGLFILKVDPHNGGSSHLVFGTEDLEPGGKIVSHRHPGSDEILFFQNGRARVSLGDTVREVHGGATVFIPANTWISVTNIGSDAISAIFIFSAPGFEDFMRAESVSEGDKLVPLSKAQDSETLKKHAHAVIYAEP
jgi:quercetin dioxygenase-like cupin family protein